MKVYWNNLLDPWGTLWDSSAVAPVVQPWWDQAAKVLACPPTSEALARVELLECYVQALRAAQEVAPILDLVRDQLGPQGQWTTPLRLGVATVLDASSKLAEALAVLSDVPVHQSSETCSATALHVQMAMGRLLVLKGDESRATKVLLAGIGQANTLGARRQEAKMLGNLGFLYGESAAVPFETFTRRALAIGRELSDVRLTAHSLCNLGAALSSQDRLDEAWSALTEGLALARSVDWRHSEALITGAMGGVLARRGDLSAAVLQYQSAAGAFEQMGDLYQVARQFLNLAEHLWRAGDVERACETLTKCQVICDGDRFLQLAWQAHELRSRVAERRGYLEIAYTSLRAAWTIRNALEEARGAERIRLLELHTEAEQARVEAAEAHGRSEIMEALAFRDALTGLANRRSLTERLQAEVARARRRGRPLLVAVVDVDSFKNVNDTLGHAAGDDVLVALGERLLQTLRREDVVGRWGGEEFCVLCPDTNAEAGEIVMGRLVAAASASPIATRSGDVQVTVSIGAALLALDDRHFDDLLGRADLALYSAKHAGKNRYQFAQPPVGVSLAPAVA